MNSKNEFQNMYKIIQTNKFPCIQELVPMDQLNWQQTKKIYNMSLQKQFLQIVFPAKYQYIQYFNIQTLLNCYKSAAILVLQYIPNGSLENIILKECLTEQQILKIFKGICQGLNQIHRNGIIHRDIKPSNILLTKNLSAKICDFGSATSQMHANKMSGTFAYLAPQMINQINYDFKVDIWSAGVILYEMMQNELPFIQKDKQRLMQKMKKPLKFSKIHSQKLMEIAISMLKYNPQKRIQLNEVIKQINVMIKKFQEKVIRNKQQQKQYIQISQQSTKDQIQDQLNVYCKLKLKQAKHKNKIIQQQKQKQSLFESQKKSLLESQKLNFKKQHINHLKSHKKISLKLPQNNKQKINFNTAKSQNIIMKQGSFTQKQDKQLNQIQRAHIIKYNKGSQQNPCSISKKISLKRFSSYLNK